MSRINLQPFRWDVIDEGCDDGHVQLQIWALDEQDQAHLVRIEDYPTFCYLELPFRYGRDKIVWNNKVVGRFVDVLAQKLENYAPCNYSFSLKRTYYYYGTKPRPMVRLTFDTLEAINKCVRLFKYDFYFPGIGKIPIKIWEHNIPYTRKLLTQINLAPAQWFSIPNQPLPEMECISKGNDEYLVSWQDITPIPFEETLGRITHPKILVYDIEANSKNKRAFPDKHSTSDVAYMNGVIVGRTGLPQTRQRFLIVAGDCSSIPGVEVIKCQDEIEAIRVFETLIQEHDPDIISGYNHHMFDNEYLNTRLDRVFEEWGNNGRLLEGKTVVKKDSWSSSAYGDMKNVYLMMDGRISIDVLTVVKRDHKLPRYNLDIVGQHFLGRGKHDVSPYDIFVTYQKFCLSHPEDDDYQERLDDMKRIGEYCLEDVELTFDLFEKLNIWIASVELSNVVGIPIFDLYTRGQQIRCLNKLYDVAHRRGIVVDFHPPLLVSFEGGSVENPIPGLEDQIPAYDVNAMYPNVMISENIGHDTFIPDNIADRVKDDDCNIIEFDQHELPKIMDKELSEKEKKKLNDAPIVHRRLRFIKKEKYEGVIPSLLHDLLAARKKVKAEMKPLEGLKYKGEPYDEVLYNILNQRQLAIKVTTNSFYGFLGAYIGKMPLIEGAMAVTAKGREIIRTYKEYVVNKYPGCWIVYGDTDSFMPKFPHIENWPWEEKWKFWHQVLDEINSLYDGITNELEKVMRIICFKSKMYAYLQYRKDGTLFDDVKDLQAKGITLARRDGTPWVRNHYRKIIHQILVNYSTDENKTRLSLFQTIDSIVEMAKEMIEQRVDWKDLAKINEVSRAAGSPLAPLVTHLRQLGRPVQPGDRIQYLICDIPGIPRTKVGPRLRSADEFKESQETNEPLKLDVSYYLTAAAKKIDPLFATAFLKHFPWLEIAGYKPNSARHFVAVKAPLTMTSRIYDDGEDLDQLKDWFQQQAESYQNKRHFIFIQG